MIRYGLDKSASGFESAATSTDRFGAYRYQVTMNGNLPLSGDPLWPDGERVHVAGRALKLKDELKFAFDIVARKRE